MKQTHQRLAGLFLALPMLLLDPSSSYAACTGVPEPASLEEVVQAIRNDSHRELRRAAAREDEPALLALSDGEHKLAYAAGMVAGWADTGRRPELAVVTAAGKGALIAPFAFAGYSGDVHLGELALCRGLKDWAALAEDVAERVNGPLRHAIVVRHRSGARLLVALPGSPLRGESVWDLGALVETGRPDHVARLMHAAADEKVAPPDRGGLIVERNWIFREAGAGEAFLWPRSWTGRFASVTLIHAAVLFPDDSDAFAAARTFEAQPRNWLVPAAEVLAAARASGARLRFASVKPMLNLQGNGGDVAAARLLDPELFRHAYRQARMGKEWRSGLPSLVK